MQRIPISRAVRPTRMAISPRFAIRSLRNIGSPLQRDVSVLFRGAGLSLRAKHRKRLDHPGAGLRRLDYVVDVAHPRGEVRVRETAPVLPDKLFLHLQRGAGPFLFLLLTYSGPLL